MKKSFLFVTLLFFISIGVAQNEIKRGTSGKTYIFNYDVSLPECDIVGQPRATPQIIPKGSKFYINHIRNDGYVIVILEYKLPSVTTAPNYTEQLDKRRRLNFISNPNQSIKTLNSENDNIRHFFLSNDEFINSVAELKPRGEWNYGTLIQPFKFRSNPSFFTTDLSLGAVVGYQFLQVRQTKWNAGIYGGLSLTKVILDSLSTGGTVRTNTERPAFTPSINLLLGYGNVFSITAGIGWDIINKTSSIEKSWVYQGKSWIGLGIGIKLFTPNIDKTITSERQDQIK
ncbi:MAG: hypothetical protein QM768_10055 [Agriterribacter sp.]